jgi:hypothetical protein
VASLGTGDYKEVDYSFDGRGHRTRLAPVAVAHLVEPHPEHVVLLLTAEARAKWLAPTRDELEPLGIGVDVVDIGRAIDENELHGLVHDLDACIRRHAQPGDRVRLDVTLALRHLPFIYLAALSLARTRQGVRLDGVYYGANDLASERGVPLLDLTPLVTLIDWQAAVGAARRWGDFRHVAELLQADNARLASCGLIDRAASRAARASADLARAAVAGLALEAGQEGARLRDAVASAAPPQTGWAKTARLVLDDVAREAQTLALPSSAPKKDLRLDVAELRRELALAERYARGQALPATLVLLREWLVNVVLHVKGDGSRWLERSTRERAEADLRALEHRSRLNLASPQERALASLWSALSEARNKYAHGGFRKEQVGISDEYLEQRLAEARTLLEHLPVAPLMSQAGGRLLITALGLSPGVLSSALRHRPAACAIVVTSKAARAGIEPALTAAGAPGLMCHVVEMLDPHFGFAEGKSIASGQCATLAQADEVVVNLTGGTTAMAHVVQCLAEAATRLGARVVRCALVDQRSIDDQRRAPHVLGDIIDL